METLKNKLKFLFQDDRSFSKRLLIALTSNFLLAFTLIFSGSCEIFLYNIMDFSFMPFETMVLIMGIFSLLYIILATGLMMILKGKIFDLVVTLPFSLSLCSFLQCNYFNGALGSMNGEAIAWHDNAKMAVLNLFIWIILLVLPIIVRYFSRNIWKIGFYIISSFLILVQLISLVSLYVSTDFSKISVDRYLSGEGIFDVSDKNNVIVFIADNFDNTYIDRMLEEQPDYFQDMKGFTRYTNCVSLYKWTQNSVPFLLSGEKWRPDEGPHDYQAYAISRGSFINDMNDLNCRIGIYTDDIYIPKDAEHISNFTEEKAEFRITGVIRAMETCVLYRDMPYIMKPSFWYYTGDLPIMALKDQSTSENEADLSKWVYVLDDVKFYDLYKKNGLSLINESEFDSYFNFIHLNGAHDPYVMNEKGESDSSATDIQQFFGSFNMMKDYLNSLESLGIYEDSTIIILADHGIKYFTKEVQEPAPSPILFVKPAGKGMNDEYVESSAPVSHEDFQATVIDALGGDGSKYGRRFDEIPENEHRIRHHYFWNYVDSDETQDLLDYEIDGDVKDIQNWTLIGSYWKNY